MSYAPTPGAVLAALSGLALVGLGLAVLRIRPRTRASLAFGAFAGLWGASVFTANVGDMATDPAVTRPWVMATLVLLLPVYVPLLIFVTSHPWPTGRRARSPVLLGLLALPALVLLLLLFAAPTLFVQDIVPRPNPPPYVLTRIGPLYDPFTAGNSVFAFAAALGLVAWKLQRARGEAEREQLALLTAAFVAYVSYRAADLVGVLFLGGAAWLAPGGPAALATRVAIDLAALLVVGAVVARSLRTRDLPWKEAILACAAIPAAFGVAEAAIVQAGFGSFRTVGLWRLVMVGLFAYAIARHRMFDVEVRLRTLAPAASYAVATFVGLAAVWTLAWQPLTQSPALGLAASVGVAATCAPAARVGRGAVHRAAPYVEEKEYLYKRKVDVYRAALEEAHARGAGEKTEQVFLSELRRDLGISEAEHRVLLLVLQSQERYARLPRPASGTRFRVERELGRGSFGRAVLARDTVLDRPVVLKQPLAPWLLEKDGRARFLQEARLGARIKHPNVVAIHDVIEAEDPPMMVMEYVAGGSLEDRLHRERRLPPAEAVRITLEVLAGLQRIHEAGIIHRDLKPGNILLDADGTAKITDFGIAHPPTSLARVATLATSGGAQPGSLAYMSPEQASGEPLDARSDLYSLGAVLYESLTGRSYIDFGGGADFAIRQRIRDEAPRLPANEVPPPLEEVLRQALAKQPAARFGSAAQMAAALRKAALVSAPPAEA